MQKNYYYVIAAFVLGLGLAISATYALASDSPANSSNPVADAAKQRVTDMQTAIDNKDYEAWKSLISNPPILSIITKDNFDRFAEMHALMKTGKTEEANEIREELGLGAMGAGRGMMQGLGKGQRGVGGQGCAMGGNGGSCGRAAGGSGNCPMLNNQ